MKTIEQGTQVTWKMGDAIFTGRVVSGPFRWTDKQKEERIKNGWLAGPYHNVRCNETESYHQVITSFLKIN